MSDDSIDKLAENLGAVFSIIESLQSIDTDKASGEHEVLLEYCLGYVEACFKILYEANN